MKKGIFLILFAVSALWAHNAYARQYESIKEIQRSFQAGASPTLSVDAIYGNITIVEWDRG